MAANVNRYLQQSAASASDAAPLIEALHRQADDWRHAEMARARRLLAKGGSLDDALEALSRGLTRKLMHGALAELHAVDGAHREELERTMWRLFLDPASAAAVDAHPPARVQV